MSLQDEALVKKVAIKYVGRYVSVPELPQLERDIESLLSRSESAPEVKAASVFQKDLEHTINKHSIENGSNTPDFLLAEFLLRCLRAWELITIAREKWYGKTLSINSQPAAPPVPGCPLPEKWRKDARPLNPDPRGALHQCADELESWLRSLAAGGEKVGGV